METASCFTDDLLNFSSDQNDDVLSRALSLLPHSSDFVVAADDEEEEELEWISNKDAFPMVESFVDIFPQKTSSSSSTIHFDLSPISVLETNNNNNVSSYNLINFGGIFNVPKKARSKQLRKPRRMWFECWKKKKTASVLSSSSLKPTTKSSVGGSSIGIGRKCLHCASEKTPQWRAGPHGPKTLCNACGVRYKSGRLVPEYRPASSPTFSSEVHSNSHRKIVEMRKNKMMMMTDFS